MKRNSVILLACCAMFWAGIGISNAALGVLGYIGCVVFTFFSALEKNTSVLWWTLGTMFMPFLVPPILALAPSDAGKTKGVYITKGSLGNRLSVDGATLMVRQVCGAKISFPMDKLRYIFVMIPGKFWTVLVHTSQKSSCIDLDSLSQEELLRFSHQLKENAKKGGFLNNLSEIRFCLADYNENYAQFSLKDVKVSNVDIFAELEKYREVRLKAREEWFKGNPEVIMKGQLWNKAVLDKAGYHKGKHLVAWDNVGTVLVETTNGMVARFYVLPEGVSSGTFSFGKGKYRMPVPISRTDLYTAEANFWRVNARNKEMFAQA